MSEERFLLPKRLEKRRFPSIHQTGASRDMLVASWLFLLGSAVFTTCVGAQLAVDWRSLPFWMLTVSGLLFCAGSIAFIRAFSGTEAARVLFPPDAALLSDDEVETSSCSGCRACVARHFATDLLVASWLFLVACLPVVVASVCYVVHHDDRVYFWGVLAGSLAFCVASGFFVVASYPEHLARSNADSGLSRLLARLFDDKACARTHCGSDWLVSNWLFLFLTAGWLLSSLVFFFKHPHDSEYQVSVLDSFIYFLASVFFVKGSYVAQADADAAFNDHMDFHHRHRDKRYYSQQQPLRHDDGGGATSPTATSSNPFLPA